MRNILAKVRKCDYEPVKADAPAIHQAANRREEHTAVRTFRSKVEETVSHRGASVGTCFTRSVELLPLPEHLCAKLRTTKIIERCFVEHRRRTGPLVCVVNVQGAERILYSTFQRFNLDRKNRAL
jgi:transposase-like protein